MSTAPLATVSVSPFSTVIVPVISSVPSLSVVEPV
jgi:hypothetical protein